MIRSLRRSTKPAENIGRDPARLKFDKQCFNYFKWPPICTNIFRRDSSHWIALDLLKCKRKKDLIFSSSSLRWERPYGRHKFFPHLRGYSNVFVYARSFSLRHMCKCVDFKSGKSFGQVKRILIIAEMTMRC